MLKNLHPSSGFSPKEWAKLTPAQKRAAMQRRKKPALAKVAKDALPPHDEDAERAALVCGIFSYESGAEE